VSRNSKRKKNVKTNTASNRRRLALQPRFESLEMRALLSITAATGETITPAEGAAFSGAVATFTSPDNGPFTATIDWGDGATTTVSGSSISGGPSPATFTVNGTHTYADEATDTVNVTIRDTSDSGTGTATGTATAAEADTLTAGTPETPTATAGATFTGAVATFIDTGYATNLGSDFTATINWGDGTSSTGSTVTVTETSGTLTVTGSHVYATAGPETATVHLSDDAPGTVTGSATATITVTAAPSNTLTPVGTISISATEGTTFSSTAVATFTESATSVPASDFTATVNWGDGTSSTESVSGTGGTLTVAGSHVYADELTAGTATVVLTQTTAGTATGTATGTANVAEADTLTPGTPVTAGTQGNTFSGTVATFTTSYTGNVAGDFTATINWGDGSTSTVSGSSITLTNGTLTVTGSHVYAATGAHTVTVHLNDDPPGTATATASATVTITAPANSLTPVGTVSVSATEGTTFSSTALATFTESATSLPASNYSATINWGDGTSSTGISVTGTGDGTLTVAGSHVYSDELATGTATVILTQTTAGTATATATGTANVAEADTLTAGTPVTATATQGSTFSGTVATFTTPYTGNVAGDFTATINWGDGSTSTVSGSSITATSGTLTVTGSHVYAAAGTETATVVLSDDAPGTASATATATLTVSTATVPPSVGLLAGTPGDGTPQTFVHNLYRELLGREPDSAGQAYWLGILGNNGSNATRRAEVIRGFLYSLEFETHFVTLLYADFLGRAPDPAGLQFYIGILAARHDLAEIIKFIAGSPEYYHRAGGTPAGFVTALCRDLLGRVTDPTSSFWVDQVGKEGLDNVVSGLLLTTEGANKFFNGNYLTLSGNAPVASPGSVQTGNYALANLTGNGWANLFFQGNPSSSAVSTAISQMRGHGGKNAIEAIIGLMSSSQFYG
jgi:PKD repeat protein